VGQNPEPLPPPLPSTPVWGTEVASWSNTQTLTAGNALVNGDITASTNGSSATLEVTEGDLVINGSITVLSESSLNIHVPSGTVFLHGTIMTGRTDGAADGESSGNVVIIALRIIFTGTIDTRGEDNPAGDGGSGGSVNFCTDPDGPPSGIGQTSQLMVGGTFLMSGGTGAGPACSGGEGGNFQTSRDLFDEQGGHFSGSADGAVYVSNTSINVDGGSASGSGRVRGGSSGYVYWMADSGFFFNGTLSGVGGSAASSDGDAVGGTGTGLFVNEFSIGDSGPISVFGIIDISGGSAACGPSARCTGGNSGFLYLINGTDMNYGGGTYSMRGGDCSSRGGQGGGVSFVISDGVPGDIYVASDIDASSGSGVGVQVFGSAGIMTFRTDLGDIQITGSLILNGGSGSGASLTSGPSDGGLVHVRTGDGDAADGGSITFSGSIQANGGSDSNDANDTHGADGGRVEFICDNPVGSIYLDPGSSIQLDGGDAGGPTNAGVGGSGGVLTLRTPGGNISIQSAIVARGGRGGGLGGLVTAHSDSPLVGVGDGRGGDITLHAGATLDLSGGMDGGSGLSDASAGATSPTAVTFDADGNNSNDPSENGIVQNLGVIISRGRPKGGRGGDIHFDGLDAGMNVGPAQGSVVLQGSGGGLAGGFRSE